MASLLGRQFSFEAIGTQWTLDIWTNTEESALQELLQSVHQRIEQFDQRYSRFRADSWVSEVAAAAGSYALPVDAEPLLHVYDELFRLSDGSITPLIGGLLEQAGYDAEYSLAEKSGFAEQIAPKWQQAVTYADGQLQVSEPVVLDFGAAGKGYLVDQISELLEAAGITQYCVDASGDMRYRHPRQVPLRVGLENPFAQQQVIGVVELTEGSLCASSGNRRRWGTHHHIMDAQTKRSPEDIAATWVVAPRALEADALATALYLVSPDILEQAFSFEYLILYDGYRVQRSDDFPVELFTASSRPHETQKGEIPA